MATEGKLYLAPLDKDKIHNVLDIGTGTGICEFLPGLVAMSSLVDKTHFRGH